MNLVNLFERGGSESQNLRGILIEELKDLYSAENQLLKALSQMEEKASTPTLKKIFFQHRAETEKQVKRLDDCSSLLKTKLSGKTCKAMQGLISESQEIISEHESGPLLDAMLIGAAQRVEHYEIAAYGAARTIADCLGERKVVKALDMSIKEEGNTDRKLTVVSEKEVLPSILKRDQSQQNDRGMSGRRSSIEPRRAAAPQGKQQSPVKRAAAPQARAQGRKAPGRGGSSGKR